MNHLITKNLQSDFLKKVKQKLPYGNHLAETLSIILDIDASSSYKRIRGETSLKLNEFILLAQKHNISIDELIYKNFEDEVKVTKYQFVDDLKSAENLLTDLVEETNFILQQPHEFYFAARDMPHLSFFRTEELSRFKLYIWLSSINSSFKRSFCIKDIPTSLVKKALQLGENYFNMTTHEIWTNDTFNSEIQQVSQSLNTGKIDRSEALILLKHYKELISYYYTRLEKEKANMHIYHADYLLSSNNALLVSSSLKKAYLNINSVNYLHIKQGQLCDDLENWFKEQISFSTNLVNNYKQRLIFFNSIKRSIDQLHIKLKEEFKPF